MASATTISEPVTEYLERVRELYADIREWMSEEPGVTFSEDEKTRLNEEYTGPYKAPILKVARKQRPFLTFVPKGAYVVGAMGRVEALGPLGSETLVWVEEGGPAIAFRQSAGGDVEVLHGRPLFPGVSQGWAWVDNSRRRLVHLDRKVFLSKVVRALSE